jgi:alcohol dehydrogenase (cytochrome c)
MPCRSHFNPNTRLIYASTWNVPRIQKLAMPKPILPGRDSTGVISRVFEARPGEILGYLAAIDPLTGEFMALDQDTGKTLWQFKTGSSVNSTAITYTHRGRQYVTIASGLGGILATRYASLKVPAGGSAWTFALMPE